MPLPRHSTMHGETFRIDQACWQPHYTSLYFCFAASLPCRPAFSTPSLCSPCAGLSGDQAGGLPAFLLCGAGRPVGHPLQRLQSAGHLEVRIPTQLAGMGTCIWRHFLTYSAARYVGTAEKCTITFACRHLPKCFDNLHNLEFRKDADGQPTKVAVGMYSGEGEYVAFASDCICDGPVENWLQVCILNLLH